MKKVLIILIILFSASVLFADISEKEFLKAYKEISLEKDAHKKLDGAVKTIKSGYDYQKFLMLKSAAEASFELGNYKDARRYATELLTLADHFKNDWNYGNAIHHGNLIIGRVALQENDIKSAKEYLLKAGNTKGSPQLNTFGPNMSLASELLDKGEKETVIEYFELCKKFWEMNDGRLDSWIASIKGGGKPYFGANLNY
ncbi:MAG: hypothetical protein HN975_06990 [Anaerolineae bacterium]|jgi:tetratricopeptide (TPR) repeat protein|nr:hypothetical protein [Anaerolineae bacterium]